LKQLQFGEMGRKSKPIYRFQKTSPLAHFSIFTWNFQAVETAPSSSRKTIFFALFRESHSCNISDRSVPRVGPSSPTPSLDRSCPSPRVLPDAWQILPKRGIAFEATKEPESARQRSLLAGISIGISHGNARFQAPDPPAQS
jgi:hypothetical protein